MASRSAPVDPNDIAKGSLGRLLGGPVASRRAPVDPNEKLPRYTLKLYALFIGFTAKVETCAIMEREARKVQEKKYASNSNEQVRLSNAAA